MDDRHYRKRLISIVGVVGALLVGGLVFVSVSSAGREFIGGPGSIMGWAIPVAALFSIAAITWLLLMNDHQDDADPTRYVPCWSCERSVMSEWRLCPYCGVELRAWKPAAGDSLDRG